MVDNLLKDGYKKDSKLNCAEIGFYGEETGGELTDKPTWVVDPLDGTKNFARGFPQFGISIGLVENKKPIFGVIYFPLLNLIYYGSESMGAYRNKKKIQVKNPEIKTLDESFLATGFPHSNPDYADIYVKSFEKILLKAMGIRRYGAATYDLCCLADGNFDAFWEYGLKPWDTAAGAAIAMGTGIKITQCNGDDWLVDSDSILASKPLLYDDILDTISQRKNKFWL